MAGKIQFTLNGEAQEFAGAVTGKGSLKLETNVAHYWLDVNAMTKPLMVREGGAADGDELK